VLVLFFGGRVHRRSRLLPNRPERMQLRPYSFDFQTELACNLQAISYHRIPHPYRGQMRSVQNRFMSTFLKDKFIEKKVGRT
jgi:hypothetical protein